MNSRELFVFLLVLLLSFGCSDEHREAGTKEEMASGGGARESTSPAEQAQLSIHNGEAVSYHDHVKSYAYLNVVATPSGTSGEYDLGGTLTDLRYRRCYITAGHVARYSLSYPDGDSRRAYLLGGRDRVEWGDRRSRPEQSLYQYVKAISVNPAYLLSKHDGKVVSFVDLAVVWTTGFLGADVTPLSKMKPAMTLAPGYKDFKKGQLLEMAGYGKDENDLYGDLKRGHMKFSSYRVSPWLWADVGGADFDLDGDQTLMQNVKDGDSGGPVLTATGALVGVTSRSTDVVGDYIGYGRFTALLDRSHSASWSYANNYDWFSDAIELNCRKSLTVGVQHKGAPRPTNPSYVASAAIVPEQAYRGVANTAVNNKVLTDAEVNDQDLVVVHEPLADMTEYFHDDWMEYPVTSGSTGMKIKNAQKMTIQAVPAKGWSFSHWRAAKGQTCPCIGKGARCAVNYAQIGLLSDTLSSDESFCVAVVVPNNTSSPGERPRPTTR